VIKAFVLGDNTRQSDKTSCGLTCNEKRQNGTAGSHERRTDISVIAGVMLRGSAKENCEKSKMP
jgi:hypothetical protein